MKIFVVQQRTKECAVWMEAKNLIETLITNSPEEKSQKRFNNSIFLTDPLTDYFMKYFPLRICSKLGKFYLSQCNLVPSFTISQMRDFIIFLITKQIFNIQFFFEIGFIPLHFEDEMGNTFLHLLAMHSSPNPSGFLLSFLIWWRKRGVARSFRNKLNCSLQKAIQCFNVNPPLEKFLTRNKYWRYNYICCQLCGQSLPDLNNSLYKHNLSKHT